MGRYVDGFLIPVPKKRIAEYRRFARTYDALWMKHGALAVHECVADDVKPGKRTSFPQAVKLKADEVVVLSWIVYRSRSHRDAVNKKVMADPEMANVNPEKIPFDGNRMMWGGFKEIVGLLR
jgi:uncharacterized protein YbaA (DUF1428 family)